ncbi:transcriptional regulator [bacterium]|nr:transcriptional regulator [bacterium]MCG2676244.1 transcriptional regulator [bacterium]
MPKFDYKQLDKIIHGRVRLGILTALLTGDEVDFNFLKEKLNLTDGNLSVHMRKLEEAGYIRVKKRIEKRKTRTSCTINSKGRKAFENYLKTLQTILLTQP